MTERELQVLRGMSEGKSNGQIGRELYLAEVTVKTHARRMFRKLRVKDRAEAVAQSFRCGSPRHGGRWSWSPDYRQWLSSGRPKGYRGNRSSYTPLDEHARVLVFQRWVPE